MHPPAPAAPPASASILRFAQDDKRNTLRQLGGPRTNRPPPQSAELRSAWPDRFEGKRVRTHAILLTRDHCTGAALAITGPCASADVASMRITCPGAGGTSPMRRASTSIRSGSRSDASSSRNAWFISVFSLSSRLAASIW